MSSLVPGPVLPQKCLKSCLTGWKYKFSYELEAEKDGFLNFLMLPFNLDRWTELSEDFENNCFSGSSKSSENECVVISSGSKIKMVMNYHC